MIFFLYIKMKSFLVNLNLLKNLRVAVVVMESTNVNTLMANTNVANTLKVSTNVNTLKVSINAKMLKKLKSVQKQNL